MRTLAVHTAFAFLVIASANLVLAERLSAEQASDVTHQAMDSFTIPLLDLAAKTDRQVVVDREEGQYLGHPTTVLLEDGKANTAFA